jgi:hypothetical protein
MHYGNDHTYHIRQVWSFPVATINGRYGPSQLVMFGLGLALKPGLWLGLSGLWLEVCQARAQARRQGLAWLGLGLSPGLTAIFFGPREGG